ncbi:MAG: BMP family lipoprotein [Gemmatimonadota bacterium]
MIHRIVSLVLVVAIISCGTGGQGDEAPFSVALLTPGSIADQSWNGGAYEGLLRMRDSLGARVSHIQTRTPAEFEENFRQYGREGYTAVFGHGFEFQDAAMRVAPDFPNTLYITTSGTTTGPNVAGIRFAFEEPAYIAGVMAGLLTHSGMVGGVGGTELPPVRAGFDAFAAGARAARPDVQVIVSYVGNWDDPGAGKEQALALIGRGVDVIFQNADAAGLGVFQAARERRGVWVFGSNADQNHIAPEVTLGSVVIDLPLAFHTIGREIRDGSFSPRVVALGASSQVVRFVHNPAAAASVPDLVRQSVDSVERAIQSGALVVTVASRDTTTR